MPEMVGNYCNTKRLTFLLGVVAINCYFVRKWNDGVFFSLIRFLLLIVYYIEEDSRWESFREFFILQNLIYVFFYRLNEISFKGFLKILGFYSNLLANKNRNNTKYVQTKFGFKVNYHFHKFFEFRQTHQKTTRISINICN